jgi:hypothetical protein
LIRSFSFGLAASLALCATGAVAQTKLQQQLSRIDLGIQGVGEFSKTVSGVPTIQSPVGNQIVTIDPSNTVGALISVRYSAKPYIGAEFNGGYSRYTENLNVQPLAIQTQVDEFTFGYLVVPPYTILGVKPYASAGVGGLRFGPTRGGGEGAPSIGRFATYYSLGVQKDVVPGIFGLRVGFRQLFYGAPDFYQNYLTIGKHTSTSEPMFGFYIRF